MGHDVLKCPKCGDYIMEGHGDWKCGRCSLECNETTKWQWRPFIPKHPSEFKPSLLDFILP